MYDRHTPTSDHSHCCSSLTYDVDGGYVKPDVKCEIKCSSKYPTDSNMGVPYYPLQL